MEVAAGQMSNYTVGNSLLCAPSQIIKRFSVRKSGVPSFENREDSLFK
jgi:hypothetical protein